MDFVRLNLVSEFDSREEEEIYFKNIYVSLVRQSLCKSKLNSTKIECYFICKKNLWLLDGTYLHAPTFYDYITKNKNK